MQHPLHGVAIVGAYHTRQAKRISDVSEPDLPYAPDSDPEHGRATRHGLLDMVEQEEMIMLGSHMTRPGWGRLIRWEGRRYWQAL